MEKPFIAKFLHMQVQAQEVAEVGLEEAEDTSDVGTSLGPEEAAAQTLETIEEEEQPASNVAEFVSTCNHLNYISYNILNSSNSPLMTKALTPSTPQSPTPSS